MEPLELYNYDGMGNLTSKVDRKSQTTGYQYDGLNRLHIITYADGSTLTITWDAGNRPTQFVDSINGTITRQYDGLDRMTEEVTPQGQLDYVYDAAGRRTQQTVAGYSAVTYQYDTANRLTQIAQGANIVAIAYDSSSRRSSVTLPNGIVATPTFDAANQLLSLSYDAAGTHIGDLAYTYDAAGRRSTQSGSLATLNLPTTVSSASYDAANRLTNWGGSVLSYDANGNLTNSGASTYSWNSRNQLTATSDGGGSFGYDSIGRRASRTVGGVATAYTYDGLNPAIAGSTSLLAGLGLDEFYAETAPSATISYISDGLGSTVAASNSSGAIIGNISYGPYGTTTGSGSGATAIQYAGRENDGATVLYFNRARYYSPQLGRFISEDPIGLNGGTNYYAYADGNPISETDPEGTFGIIGGLVGAGIEIGKETLIQGKSLRCVNIGAVIVSAAIGAFSPGLLTIGKTAAGVTGAVAAGWGMSLSEQIAYQATATITKYITINGVPGGRKDGLASKPWTVGSDCECSK